MQRIFLYLPWYIYICVNAPKLLQIGETFSDPIHLTSCMHYKNILTIVSDACTINVLLAQALALD